MTNMEQLRLNVEQLVMEYGNGQADNGTTWYPNLSLNQWYEYCVPEIYNMQVINQGFCRYVDGICDHLKFMGTSVIREVIAEIATEEGLVA